MRSDRSLPGSPVSDCQGSPGARTCGSVGNLPGSPGSGCGRGVGRSSLGTSIALPQFLCLKASGIALDQRLGFETVRVSGLVRWWLGFLLFGHPPTIRLSRLPRDQTSRRAAHRARATGRNTPRGCGAESPHPFPFGRECGGPWLATRLAPVDVVRIPLVGVQGEESAQ